MENRATDRGEIKERAQLHSEHRDTAESGPTSVTRFPL